MNKPELRVNTLDTFEQHLNLVELAPQLLDRTDEDRLMGVLVAADSDKLLQRELKVEQSLIGIDPKVDPTGFLEKRNKALNVIGTFLNNRLGGLKERLTTLVAERLASYDGRDPSDHESDLRQRLAATKRVNIEDSLMSDGATRQGGRFNPICREPVLTTAGIFQRIQQALEQDEDPRKAIEEDLLAHELMHGLYASAIADKTQENELNIDRRNGLEVRLADGEADEAGITDGLTEHGTWVSEATVEIMRTEVFDRKDLRYKHAAALLETLYDLNPDLKPMVELAAIQTQGPGQVFGEIENYLGPNGVEEAQQIIDLTSDSDSIHSKIMMIDMMAELFVGKEDTKETFGSVLLQKLVNS